MSDRRRATYSGLIRGYDHNVMEALVLEFTGVAAAKMAGLAAYAAGRSPDEAAERAGMDIDGFKKLIGDFRDHGVPALHIDGSTTCLSLPENWSVAKLRPYLKKAGTKREAQRIQTAMFVCAGEKLSSIAGIMETTPSRVRLLFDDFILYGPVGAMFPSAPRPKADRNLVRRLSEIDPDARVKKNAAMFSAFIEGEDVSDIVTRHGVRLRELVNLLRRLHVLGIEALYPAKARVPVKAEGGPDALDALDDIRSHDLSAGSFSLDRDTLIRQSRGVKDSERRLRLNALSMLADGKTCSEVGRFYDVSGQSVRKWQNAYVLRGIRGI
ncbi:helix-turn-helix domain-containing protein [Agrobacterium rubi]|nr:helix-turn-helix domain-containing protein [Agrobacterium rubi]NTF24990.1 helix-turn-helix domain-containing protein [Agrobacterium rubi]